MVRFEEKKSNDLYITMEYLEPLQNGGGVYCLPLSAGWVSNSNSLAKFLAKFKVLEAV